MQRNCKSTAIAVACSMLFFLAAGESRNPFGIADIADPTGDDVLAHHDRAPLEGGDRDANATAWPARLFDGDLMKFDGRWSGRWNSGEGSAWSAEEEVKIVKTGDRLFILQNHWYIEGIRQRDGRYAGRWVSTGSTTGGGTWVGRIVSDERIDGDWASGRWDFRRRLE